MAKSKGHKIATGHPEEPNPVRDIGGFDGNRTPFGKKLPKPITNVPGQFKKGMELTKNGSARKRF